MLANGQASQLTLRMEVELVEMVARTWVRICCRQ